MNHETFLEKAKQLAENQETGIYEVDALVFEYLDAQRKEFDNELYNHLLDALKTHWSILT